MACVLDSSALLALLFDEPGKKAVAEAIDEGAAVNLPVICHDLDFDLAMRCGALFAATKSAGLSLGDRMCLALAIRDGIPALTADRAWSAIAPAAGAVVKVIR